MSRERVGEVLQELGAILLLPGIAYESRKRLLVEAPELQAALDQACQRLIESPAEQLDIAYAGLFLHGYNHPTLHLEESVMRCGELRAPAVLADLNKIYQAAELEVLAPFESDHLGAMAALLGHLLQRMNEAQGPVGPDLQGAASDLLSDHLKPLQSHVSKRLEQMKAHPYYCRVVDLLGVVLLVAEALLPVSESHHLSASEA